MNRLIYSIGSIVFIDRLHISLLSLCLLVSLFLAGLRKNYSKLTKFAGKMAHGSRIH